MKEDYDISQKVDGVSFNWNLFPSTRLEASQLLSPVGCLYSPLHKRAQEFQEIQVLDKIPLRCELCENFINPYIKIDRASRMWVCPYCDEKSSFPRDYELPLPGSDIEQWPLELRQSSSTIEYLVPPDASIASDNYNRTHWFILDCYQHVDELQNEKDVSFNSLKLNICKIIDDLPEDTLIGLITFDEFVFCHKINSGDSIAITKKDVYQVDAETGKLINVKNTQLFDKNTSHKILKKLGCEPGLSRDSQSSPLLINQYLVPVSASNKDQIKEYIQSIRPKLTNSFKPPRSTGLALYVISTLLSQVSYKGYIGHVSLFCSGPCTESPGNIIDTSKTSTLRGHNDIANFEIPQFLSSLKFYKTLSLVASGFSLENAASVYNKSSGRETDYPVDGNAPKWTFDLFSGSLDQVGIYEMKSLSLHTVGGIYLFDSFNSPQFTRQLLDNFDLSRYRTFNNVLTVKTSSKLKVSRLIGSGHALPSSYQSEKHYETHHEKIADHLSVFDSGLKKKSFTNQWLFNVLSPEDTLSIFFEPETVSSSSRLESEGIEDYYIQFQLKYWDPKENCWKLRVTNVTRKSTLYYLKSNKVKMTDGSYKLINSKSKIIKEKELLSSFDQSSFTILLARLLLDKIDTTLGFEKFDDIIKDIDKTVIKLLFHFGGLSLNIKSGGSNPYSNLLSDIVEKYEINRNFTELPSLAYNLRKNPLLIRIFNSLPDETAFYHHWFQRTNDTLSKSIVQPKLFQVNEEGSKEVSLDSQNVQLCPLGDFLIMDSIFNVTIYSNGENLNLHHSDNQGLMYDDQEILKIPLEFINNLPTRPVSPKFIVTQKNHSQARFLLARLNPLEDSLEQSFEKLDVGNKGFFGLFNRKPKAYTNLLTDDISLDNYYHGLIHAVKNYRVTDE